MWFMVTIYRRINYVSLNVRCNFPFLIAYLGRSKGNSSRTHTKLPQNHNIPSESQSQDFTAKEVSMRWISLSAGNAPS